ncbi:hypothetical protein EHI7A_001280, partial [Entamoeba histolytica HM-1:IMSS-A]
PNNQSLILDSSLLLLLLFKKLLKLILLVFLKTLIYVHFMLKESLLCQKICNLQEELEVKDNKSCVIFNCWKRGFFELV